MTSQAPSLGFNHDNLGHVWSWAFYLSRGALVLGQAGSLVRPYITIVLHLSQMANYNLF